MSQDVLNDRSGTVIALAITSQEPRVGFPLAFELTAPELPKRSWVKINQIRTLATERLGSRLASVPREDLQKVLAGLNLILGP